MENGMWVGRRHATTRDYGGWGRVSRTGIFHVLFALFFLTLSFRLDLIILTTLVQTHFARLFSSQINKKRVY